MVTKNDTLLSKALIEKKILTQEALQPVLDEASSSKESLFSLLLKKRLVSEEELLKLASGLLRLPVIDLVESQLDVSIADKVPLKVAEYYKIAPIRLDKRKLTVAVSAPLDLRTQDDIRAHLGFDVEVVLARERDIVEALKKIYGFAAGTIGEMIAQSAAAPSSPGTASSEAFFEKVESIENVERLAGDASIAKLVNQIILEAYRKRATDIHVEPYRGKVKIRYRIDGVLYNANVTQEIARFISPILSRIKIMSNLNIVERRLPQDGRAIVKVEDTQLDLRVSSIPTPYGESVVIRMLPMNRVFDLEKLGLSKKQLKIFEDLINTPHGVIFLTGPTGSGKSTTLYACLNKINTDERKIITIEDPVEYEMEGVTQIQVTSSIGLDFARGLRSMLRDDPDVMMVGEVRDLETAEMAIRVALTGHLVFSTLHTNDSASGVTRLSDIGIQPYLVASSVIAFVAQRLVRMICPHCKEEDKTAAVEIKNQIAKELGLSSPDFPVYHGKGCSQCNFTGFWGRCAIYGIFLVSENIRRFIMLKATSNEMKREAVSQGMRTIRQDGWEKVVQGVTTPGEIFEATPEEDETPAAESAEAEDPGARSPRPKGFKKPVDFAVALKNSVVRSGGTRENSPADRRLFMRMDLDVTVYYRVVKLPEAPLKMSLKQDELAECSYTKNISAGGLSFFTGESVEVGSVVELRIQIPDKESIECLARVIRDEEIELREVYEVAVCFLDLSSKQRQLLEKFVQKEKFSEKEKR